LPPICSGGHPACRIWRHLAARTKKRTHLITRFHIKPPGWKPGYTAAKDGCRYGGSARNAPGWLGSPPKPYSPFTHKPPTGRIIDLKINRALMVLRMLQIEWIMAD
jgi:hypothetical protein